MYPKVNQNIVISIDSEDQSFQAIVSDINEKEISISLPVDEFLIKALTVKTKISVIFVSNDNQFKFQSEITGRKIDRIQLYSLKKPQAKDVMKVQRRDNFRVKTSLLLKLNDNNLNTINISAGGMLFSCSAEMNLQLGDTISGILFIPFIENKEVDPIHFHGIIRRITLTESPVTKNVAIEFVNLIERDQINLIQYCFYKQKQNRLMDQERS